MWEQIGVSKCVPTRNVQVCKNLNSKPAGNKNKTIGNL